MPWSKTPKGFQSKTGGSTFGTQALDDLRPAGERTVRTTTVTGGRKSDSDEENFLDTGLPEERWEGIRKGVTTTVTSTEVAPDKQPKTSGGYTYGTSKSNKRRSFSLGQDSNSSLDDEGRKKPVGTFNPFQ